MLKRIKHVHFVGIGGIGMSGIAEVLLNLGYKVTGSDVRPTAITERLERLGATIFPRHIAENVIGAHVVVTSSAVRADNPEIQEAERHQIPVIPRAEMLAELARLKYSITVAGTHGKTTTTSMIATILDRAGLDPTIVVGGRLDTIGSNARLGKGEFIVLEADESDRSFLLLSPTIAVVTNIEADHLDHYRDLEDIQTAFLTYINKVPFYGAAILCLDEPAVQSLIPQIKRRIVTYGTAAPADVSITDVHIEGLGSTFVLRFNGGAKQKVRLKVPGMHNVLNATGAFAAVREMGMIEPNVVAAALESFQGVERRFQVKSHDSITVIDDYAHHPTEIRATLSAAKSGNFRRIFVIFQPHRYTRTFHLFHDFARAFNLADSVLILDIYPAGENPIEGITTPALIEKINSFGHKNAIYAPDFEMIESYITANAKEGDAVIVMGAGSVTKLADILSERFSKTA
ncbi:MAG: UDP-N-acetylmuramate--L-alanine ligase [Acidobacteria bacterium]|nr:MAG: UDP-N-acetylmuramate--L-alanine ligase [Acidobacteriota bacterium]